MCNIVYQKLSDRIKHLSTGSYLPIPFGYIVTEEKASFHRCAEPTTYLCFVCMLYYFCMVCGQGLLTFHTVLQMSCVFVYFTHFMSVNMQLK